MTSIIYIALHTSWFMVNSSLRTENGVILISSFIVELMKPINLNMHVNLNAIAVVESILLHRIPQGVI